MDSLEGQAYICLPDISAHCAVLELGVLPGFSCTLSCLTMQVCRVHSNPASLVVLLLNSLSKDAQVEFVPLNPWVGVTYDCTGLLLLIRLEGNDGHWGGSSCLGGG